ncbi:MAG: 3'(2'),5'-bisphosphate nucleotidase CysQ [Croceimicrobium sp.]
MDRIETKVLAYDAILASIEAGKEILEVYENTFEVEYKDDKSPLTIADKRAHLKIVHMLEETGIPVLSEEGRALAYEERKNWHLLWVVDPLDGTKEFIKQNGEFTVNIALIEKGVPIMGVVYVPVDETLYVGAPEFGAYRIDKAAHIKDTDNLEDWLNQGLKLPEQQDRPYTMVGSRSHMSDETAAFFEKVRREYPDSEVISRGSSLKICMVAEGSADVYPRFAPTMEWDTAAGHAVAKGAGFEIYQAKNDSEPLQYNKEDLLNPWFIVKKPNS